MLEQLTKGPDNPTYTLIVRWMWWLLFIGIVATILVFIGLSFTNLPSVTELENPKSNEASLVLGDNGDVLGRYYTENRVRVPFDSLSPHLEHALLATEDERFYNHSGIDFEALGRAVVKTMILGQENAGGASTITQQLAKQLFTDQVSRSLSERLIQKLREWIIAVRLERKYTKQEIIAMYLNKYDFINGAQGIKAAAENYFGKTPAELDLAESATLVGMLKNASLFNPLRRPDTVLHRRSVVLKQMEKNGYITAAEYDTLKTRPLGIKFSRQTHIDGLAPYFRMVLAENVKEILSRPEYRRSDGSTYDIYRDGLRIYTTLNPRMQEIAEREMEKHMASLQKRFFRHWQVIRPDPWTYKDYSSESEIPVELRRKSLERLIRNSDRYQALREEYLLPVIRSINETEKLTFHEDDREVERLVQASQKPDFIDELAKRDILSDQLADGYRSILRHSAMPRLTQQWKALQEAVDSAFNEEVEMRVFTYENAEHTKDTVMTPLDSVKYHRMILQLGSMSVEPSTGYVKTWVGGVNHKWFQFDHVQTFRQVGSTFKPFVYATTIDLRSISPCFRVTDQATTIYPDEGRFNLIEPWTPSNSNNKYSGNSVTLIQGLKNSINTVSVYLMKELESTEPVRQVVSNMGIDKEYIPAQPSIALGSVDLTVEQMTGAYTTFANNGIFNKPTYLLRIVDRNDRVIYEAIPEERQAISPQANYAMVHMLKNSRGAVRNVRGELGGKTGTTNDQTDGWYMGITPNLVVGTWVGGEDRWVRFRTLAEGQGSRMARPFFASFVEALQKDEQINWDFDRTFSRPPGDLGIILNCEVYDQQYYLPSDNMEDPFGEGRINNVPDFQ